MSARRITEAPPATKYPQANVSGHLRLDGAAQIPGVVSGVGQPLPPRTVSSTPVQQRAGAKASASLVDLGLTEQSNDG